MSIILGLLLFLVVVNLILINMMMAIINLAFEEIKENADQYKNKFELLEYIKRSAKEMIGITVAEPIVPVYMSEENARRWRRQQGDFCATIFVLTYLNLSCEHMLGTTIKSSCMASGDIICFSPGLSPNLPKPPKTLNLNSLIHQFGACFLNLI